MIEAKELYLQDSLPGFEDFPGREMDSDDLALRAMNQQGLADFIEVEDSLEAPAKTHELIQRSQEAADGYAEAGHIYQEKGFYLKTGTLKAKAALLYNQLGKPTIAMIELLDAIYLDKLADRFAKMAENLAGHDPFLPIRANYPNLFSSTYIKGDLSDPQRAYHSSPYTIFQLMNAHYALFFNIADQAGVESDYEAAFVDLHTVDADLYESYRHRRHDGLFYWNEELSADRENTHIIEKGSL